VLPVSVWCIGKTALSTSAFKENGRLTNRNKRDGLWLLS
jgi:hypothetical protein